MKYTHTHIAKTTQVSLRLKSIAIAVLLLPFHLLNLLGGAYGSLLSLIRPGLGLALFDRQLRLINSTTTTVEQQLPGRAIKLQIHTPNTLCGYRADTFFTKEPETLAWIDEYGGDGPLYDIGANIGLYSLYYAATKEGDVYSFEPSVLNLKLLAKNIHSNGFDKRIRIIPNPLTDHNDFADFSLSSVAEGGALSSFGVDYGHDGKELNSIFRYQTLGLSLDYLLNAKMIKEPPQLVKIDVDGIEHLILAGAVDILKNPNLKSLLIEVNDDFRLQATNVSKLLKNSGFYLETKRHSEVIVAGKLSGTSNQIWCRS